MKDVKIFHGLSEDMLDFISERVILEKYEVGEAVCSEGEHADAMYLIESGEVDIIFEGKKIGELGESDSFGEMSLVDMMKRSATVVAREKIGVYKFTKKSFYELYKYDIESYSIVVLNIARELSRRLRKMDKMVEKLSSGMYI